jgi:hypothetical protein
LIVLEHGEGAFGVDVLFQFVADGQDSCTTCAPEALHAKK